MPSGTEQIIWGIGIEVLSGLISSAWSRSAGPQATGRTLHLLLGGGHCQRRSHIADQEKIPHRVRSPGFARAQGA